MKYVTKEQIRQWFRGRLEVPDSPLFAGAAAGKVDEQLIEQLGNIIEAKIDVALGQIYEMPIPDTATQALLIIGGIVQKLIVSEIAIVHFQQTLTAEQGGDNGFGATIRKQALDDLEAIFAGHGIYIPGMTSPPPPNPQMGVYRQPLVLPGMRTLSADEQPDTSTRAFTFLGTREFTEEEDLFNLEQL